MENGEATEAVRVADEGLERFPKSPLLLHLRGGALFLLGQIADAERCFRDALQLKPDLALARLNLRTACSNRTDVLTLLQHLKTPCELLPKCGPPDCSSHLC
ncbi:MAG UNVERIFIED_CONTAM: tetratricopeptide repeat protein [Planctomycetaceae bacterium]